MASASPAGPDYADPNAVSNLYNNLKSAGRPVEYSGQGDLIKFLGDDAGSVDVLQNQAFEQGRGPVRGWAFQPFYGKDDRQRLLAEGRNPDTGEIGGPMPGAGPRLGATQPSPFFDTPAGEQASSLLNAPMQEEEPDPWFVDILRRFQNG